MPKPSKQVGAGREPLPAVPARDGRPSHDAGDSGAGAREPLASDTDRLCTYEAPGTTRYAKYDHVFQLGHEIVAELAAGIVAPELKAMAADAMLVGTEMIAQSMARDKARKRRA